MSNLVVFNGTEPTGPSHFSAGLIFENYNIAQADFLETTGLLLYAIVCNRLNLVGMWCAAVRFILFLL